MQVKRFLKIELSDITKDDIDGYCNISDREHKLYNEDGLIIFEVRDIYYNRSGNAKLTMTCDELILNGSHTTNVKEFCIKLMSQSGYVYSEEDGFVKIT